MSDKPSTSKTNKDESEELLPPQLDITSDEFDPLQALYANAEVKLTKRKPKVIYQNLAAFEIEYNKKGLYGMSIKSKDDIDESTTKKDLPVEAKPSTSGRRFLPHQMAIKSSGPRMKNTRSLLRIIETMEGPMAVLRDCMHEKRQIKIHTRSEHGIRGSITGFVISFDKHWNILLRDVHETWKRRKYKYDENKFCGTPSDCSERLRNLGITLPQTKAKSLNRKNVQLSRSIPQLLIRGEQIVLIVTEKANEKVEGVKS
ncbi:U7 snRNA-associated Sm-like protein LSm11 [Episyrphus balteatus]|uniref:U7 snRNA-associated Sm-like protein LSm11 n=1 Tax=Episyrphus balteatus TaxID=286459 RepID=UPI002485339D|nr:U7 snRNA-associated Sm-like protein LSm11 [Episyrphus balteatus]